MEGKTQVAAAAAAGISVRTARNWQRGLAPSQARKPRGWRTREDPFDGVWESDVVPLLVADNRRTLGDEARAGAVSRPSEENPMSDIPELTKRQLASAIPARVRKRLMAGRFESGDDVAALRRFAQLTQQQFARAVGISVHTLRNWEQGRRTPEGPAIALLRIAARHPRILRETCDRLRSAQDRRRATLGNGGPTPD